jgi:hypothetical protein
VPQPIGFLVFQKKSTLVGGVMVLHGGELVLFGLCQSALNQQNVIIPSKW